MMRRQVFWASLALMASACHADRQQPSADRKMPAPAPAPTLSAAAAAEIPRINTATPEQVPAPRHQTATPQPATPQPANTAQTPPIPFVIRAEVLLARTRFSPGVVDGQYGSNFAHAIAAYQTAQNLPSNGTVDAATWRSLLGQPDAARPVARSYVITAADVAGPFAPDVGEDFVKLSALAAGPQFNSPLEALAERFHMSQALLTALNPGVNFATAGQVIVVVDDAHPGLAKGQVARIDVSKSGASARAFDASSALIAFYPATVGSTERPSPSGTHKVVGVAWNPDYTYDPAKLKWGPRKAGKLVVKPGPNNPVGMVWIDLNAPSYGIHGTADPDTIGKTASHGCVRLTNWDAVALAAGVKPGVEVQFIGQRGG
jgi:lipoprotein-anchoring transpeptidase ErfK/SrfK